MKKPTFDIHEIAAENNFLTTDVYICKQPNKKVSQYLLVGTRGRTYTNKFSLYVVRANREESLIVYESHIGAFSTKKDALTALQACIIFKALK